MWGAVADSLGVGAVYRGVPRRRTDGPAPAFDEAMRLVDDLSAAGAGRITRRARRRDVRRRHDDGDPQGHVLPLVQDVGRTAPIGERYCLSCPLQPDPGQLARWVAWLDEVDAARVVREGAGEEHSTP